MPCAPALPISPRKVLAQRSRTRCSNAIWRPSARSRWIIASRLARPALGLVSPARWSARPKLNRMRRMPLPARRSAARRRVSPADARRRLAGLLVGAEVAAGVPVLRAVGAKDGEMLLALKSGNFGGPEFFSDALRLMR